MRTTVTGCYFDSSAPKWEDIELFLSLKCNSSSLWRFELIGGGGGGGGATERNEKTPQNNNNEPTNKNKTTTATTNNNNNKQTEGDPVHSLDK